MHSALHWGWTLGWWCYLLPFSHPQGTPASAPSPTLILSSTLQWCPSTFPSEWLSWSMPGSTWCWDKGDGNGSSLDRTASASASDLDSRSRWASAWQELEEDTPDHSLQSHDQPCRWCQYWHLGDRFYITFHSAGIVCTLWVGNPILRIFWVFLDLPLFGRLIVCFLDGSTSLQSLPPAAVQMSHKVWFLLNWNGGQGSISLYCMYHALLSQGSSIDLRLPDLSLCQGTDELAALSRLYKGGLEP